MPFHNLDKREILRDREKLKELGLWDVIYDKGILQTLSRSKGVKPWESNEEELNKELRRLGLKKEDLKLDKKPLLLDPANNPIDRVKAKYMDTGSYLRPHDILFCLQNTKFSEEKIISWFKRFRLECPDGRLSRTHLRELFQKVFPDGNSSKITGHIFRIFDSDGNDFLDFKEFLMAIDVANRDTDEDKLKWAFKLYDVDSNGVIDVKEMAAIIETLDCIEGVKPGVIRYDENGNPEPIADTKTRAMEIFAAIDRDCQGTLNEEEFIEAYKKRSEILKRQDSMEQKKKMFCIILTGPIIQKHNDFSEDKMFDLCSSVLTSRAGIMVETEDLAHVELKSVSSAETVFTKSIFVRFNDLALRMKVWSARGYAERNKLFMEEWLTDFRSNLLKKCQTLMKQEYIVNVKTKDGDIIVFYNDKVDGLLKRRVVVTQEEYDDLLRVIGKSEEFDPSKDGLAKPSPTEPNKKLEDIAEEEKT
ncbi:uncharacterized protein LOC111708396 [Eurytemora carolleeae]|uniref:uncharacterized protein LOC111708396 n=1 Tax=Eurytemora carolleeae TaxID=1294199 RepID=UPI000C761AFC|nr:uncharacterized protein LOC111708396 [Eurytemora carolleeae]|eukprot:XP_023337528.1 uncharacterized protein LOC111708396 [Eurytemora affinis]